MRTERELATAVALCVTRDSVGFISFDGEKAEALIAQYVKERTRPLEEENARLRECIKRIDRTVFNPEKWARDIPYDKYKCVLCEQEGVRYLRGIRHLPTCLVSEVEAAQHALKEGTDGK